MDFQQVRKSWSKIVVKWYYKCTRKRMNQQISSMVTNHIPFGIQDPSTRTPIYWKYAQLHSERENLSLRGRKQNQEEKRKEFRFLHAFSWHLPRKFHQSTWSRMGDWPELDDLLEQFQNPKAKKSGSSPSSDNNKITGEKVYPKEFFDSFLTEHPSLKRKRLSTIK
jgi:hypothetical protein